MRNLIIKNTKIVLVDEILSGHQVLVRDGKIAAVTEDNLENDDCQVVDGEGFYLSPGFIDIHNHGNSGFDAMNATIEALEAIARFHTKNGVTGFLATTMTESRANILRAIENAVEYTEQAHPNCSQLLGLYLEGPYFSIEKKGAQNEEFIDDIQIDELREYIERGKGLVKIVSLAPEKKKANEAIHLLKQNGVVAAAGHSMATYEETKEGIRNGISLATHMFNGMRGFSHREPGIAGACLVDDRVTCEMICDGIHLHPAAMDLMLKAKGEDKVVLISDSVIANGLPEGEYEFSGQKVIMKNSEVRLANGALAGSTLSLDCAVKNLTRLVSVDLASAVKMASLNAARLTGLAKTKGSIAVGKDADLILFNEDIQIRRTFIKGDLVYENKSIKA